VIALLATALSFLGSPLGIVAGVAAPALGALFGFSPALRARVGGVIGQHRSWLVLLAVAAIGAGLYAWGAEGRADRDRMLAWGDRVCASAGAELAPAKTKRGATCAAAIAGLAKFKADANAATTKAVLDQLEEREGKMSADAKSARAAANRARDAQAKMEAANAAIGEDDRVGSSWLSAFNDLAGLRN
jgi:hypothetical protein